MNKVIRIALFVLFIFQTDHILGQGASVAIDKDRKAWLGFNVGGFWQGSDIRPTGGAGSSLLFDYYFIRNNHSVFGIGVRGQYVKATSLGLGITRDYNIQNNPALNGSSGNPDYASLTGGQDYVFQNYSTEISDLSGNVIISLNRLRAVSRINLYVFGGIGGTGYIASMNQRDASGNLYDYNLINSSGQKSEIKDGLKNLRDDTYETYGEGGDTYSWAFTPTVGAGFGIQLSSRVQLSIEHKVGFTGTDLLDGNKYGTSNSRNDIYHYASFGLSYGVGKLIGGDGPVTTRVQPRRTPVLPVTPEEPTLNPPTIRITSPTSPSVTVENCNASIRAIIENVVNEEGISVLQDRIPIPFDFSGRSLTVSNISFTGTANFTIIANNDAGTASKAVSFTCQPKVQMITICHRTSGANTQQLNIPADEWPSHQAHGDTQGPCPEVQRPVLLAPTITINAPATSPVTLENCLASINATIENITSKEGISVIRDRTPVAFEFSGGRLTVSNVNFSGTANFMITAINSAGQATQTVSFICQPPVEMITICHRSPGAAPQEMSIPSTEWPSHQSHGDTQGVCPSVQMPAAQLPVVTITSPASSPIVLENCRATIRATVDNIDGKQNITVTMNDAPVDFTFLSRILTVSNMGFTGTANFAITATNSAGTATQTVSFVCQPPVQMITICHRAPDVAPQEMSIPSTEWSTHQSHGDTQGACPIIQQPVVMAPVVTITSPTTTSVTVENCKANITATVDNITDKQNITVTQNESPVAFEFTDKKVTVDNLDFTDTANFAITATNSAGTATQTVSFVCQPPVQMITICHREAGVAPQEMSIPSTEWSTHQSHGDTQGACPIIQQPVVLAPVVTITSPATSTVTVENCKASIIASVTNIIGREGIIVTQNLTPVTFEYVDNKVTIPSVDFTGTANFVITATNSAGTVTQTVSFVCQPPVQMITICHRAPGVAPQEMSIPSTEWSTHQSHGDEQGACPVIQAPTVTITAPTNSPITVEDCNASITATVENITNQQGISVTQNGTPVTFIFVDKTVTVSNLGFTGTANFVITATNSAGTATQTVSFICQPKQITICHIPPGNNGNPQTISIAESAWPAHQAHGDSQGECPIIQSPTVTISAPANSPITVEDCKASITATVENITNQQGISVTQNGTPVTFIFVDKTVTVSNLGFTGTANFVITATNSAGTATQTVSFICQPKQITICHIPPGNNGNPQTITIAESAWPAHQAHGDVQGACPVIQAPVVTITSPTTASVTVENCKASITATVENITDKQNITVTQNENPIAFEFADKKVIVTNVDFSGTKSFVIKATNSAGTATQSVSFVCQPKQITICHIPPGNNNNPQTITIAESAWPAHQAHGDTQGACPEVQVPVDEETSNDKDDEKDKDKDEKSEETDSDKITICHHPPGNRGNTQTLTIPASAWPAHEKHGDTKGPCKD